MSKMTDELAPRLISGAAAVGAAFAAKKAIESIWKLSTGSPPPTDPENLEVTWPEAIGWTLVSGAAIGLAQLFATRAAMQYYRRRL